MSEKRYAVLIASSEYPKEPSLKDLRYPENDVDGLNEILSSEKYGNFAETFVLKNRPANEVQKTINQVLNRAGKDDLVLIYYSGHGKLNRAGKLHLATTDTEVESLEATSIPVENIRNYIDVTSSNKVVLILDSCFSGAAGAAFAKGDVDDQLQLISGGRGTYIMTSATGIQTALEKEGDEYGVFTKHIIEGIKSGEADRDEDSLITMPELYSYVHDHVLDESHQEPTKFDLNVRGDLVIAKSGKSKREERAREIRKMVVEEAHKGNLPNYILSRSLEILDKKPNQLSEENLKYDHLLGQLHQKRLGIGEFIEEWHKIEFEQSLKEEKPKKKEHPDRILKKLPEMHPSGIERLKMGVYIKRQTIAQLIGFWLLALYYLDILYVPPGLIVFLIFINGIILGWIGFRKNFLEGVLLGWVMLVPTILILTYNFGYPPEYKFKSVVFITAYLATTIGLWTLMGDQPRVLTSKINYLNIGKYKIKFNIGRLTYLQIIAVWMLVFSNFLYDMPSFSFLGAAAFILLTFIIFNGALLGLIGFLQNFFWGLLLGWSVLPFCILMSYIDSSGWVDMPIETFGSISGAILTTVIGGWIIRIIYRENLDKMRTGVDSDS